MLSGDITAQQGILVSSSTPGFDLITTWSNTTANLSAMYHANSTGFSASLIAGFPPVLEIICFTLAGVIVILNGIVILSFVLSRRVRESMSLFMLNLTIVDFQNGFISLPLLLLFPRTELQESPMDSTALCVILIVWPVTLFVVAYQSVLLVTVERFICIAKPYTFRKILRKWRCFIVLAILWILASLFCTLPAFGYKRITDKGSLYMCNGVYQQGVVYLHLFLYGVLGVPLITIIILYIIMYKIAKKHVRDIKNLQKTSMLPGHVNKKKRQFVKTSKAAKTACLLSAFYLLCWLPFLILIQISELCKLSKCSPAITQENLQRATPPTVFLAFLGCALNPVIYIFRTGSIRSAFRSFCTRWRTEKEARSAYVSHNAQSTASSPNINALRKTEPSYSCVSQHSIF